jgi:hypothetical protein
MKLRIASGPVLIAILLAIVFSVVWVANLPINDPYVAANVGFNGTSELASKGFQVISNNFDQILSSSNPPAVLLILGPTKQFDAANAQAIRNFVIAGGVLLLADNFGSGNGLLQQLNCPIRFDGRPLLDTLFYTKEPTYPNVVDISNSSFTVNVNTILLDHATALDMPLNSSSVTVLASSSQFSFLDTNHDGQQNSGEPSGPFPVLAGMKIGNGFLIAFSSPASFTNDLLNAADNNVLLSDIVKAESHLGRNTLLFVDQTHLNPSLTTSQARTAAQDFLNAIVYGRMLLTEKLVLVASALIIVASRFMFLRPATTPPRKAETSSAKPIFDVQTVLRKHPDWNAEKLAYVARELESSIGWRKFNED